MSGCAVKVANEMHIAQPDRYEALLRYESPGMKLCSGEFVRKQDALRRKHVLMN